VASAKIDHARHLKNLEQEFCNKISERSLLMQEKKGRIDGMSEKLKRLEKCYDEKLSKNLEEKNALQQELAHAKAWPQHEYTNSSLNRLP
jgi:hypothetical protein